jgi:hypothetical protein
MDGLFVERKREVKILEKLSAIILVAGVSLFGHAQSPTSSASPTSSWSADTLDATSLVALTDVPAGTKGTIEVTSRGLIFTSSRSNKMVRLAQSRIIGVFTGDERSETGGFAGRVARIAIPFGGGAVFATITQKQVGFLTVEYRDGHDGLRSAVFVLRKAEALEIAGDMELGLLLHSPVVAPRVCNAHSSVASIHLLPIQSAPEVMVAPEYRALLYEGFADLPARMLRANRILPDGEAGAECADYTLTLTVERFSKGNAVVRASTGPVGLFVAVTKLAVRAQLRNSNGTVVLDKEVRAARRGDSESLNAATTAVKYIAKEIKRANIQSQDAGLQ